MLPSTGVPIGAATVKGTAWAVKLFWSYDEISGVSVAVDAVLNVLGSMRVELMFVLAVSVVNAPVVAVVAPTVPFMLIDAVPVKFVTVPLAGVPRAGVTSVGLVANTKEPVPVSSVKAVAN